MFESAHKDLLLTPLNSSHLKKKKSKTENKECKAINNYFAEDKKHNIPYFYLTNIKSASTILENIRFDFQFEEAVNGVPLESFFKHEELSYFRNIMNYISEAVMLINTPSTLHSKRGISVIDLIDLYMCSVLRLSFLMFKCEDYVDLFVNTKLILPIDNLLPSLICLGTYIYNHDTKCYVFPSYTPNRPPVSVHISDLLQILPTKTVKIVTWINDISKKLHFDWTMSILCMCSFFYLPVANCDESLESIRNKNVSLLEKYIHWKFGSKESTLIFHEVLKLMDAILIHGLEVQNLELKLEESEMQYVLDRLRFIRINTMKTSEFPYDASRYNNLKSTGQKHMVTLTALHMDLRESILKTITDNGMQFDFDYLKQYFLEIGKTENETSIIDNNDLNNIFEDIAKLREMMIKVVNCTNK